VTRQSIDAAVAAIVGGHAGRVFVGFSGGLDSTVVLHAAALAMPRSRLIALHVNHGLNTRAASWQRHCQRVSTQLGTQFVCIAVHVEPGPDGIEAAARGARYAAFAETLGAGDLLLLGHHQDDQAETVLWRLLRGGGSAALAAMPARRRLGRGELVRPLLTHPRSALEAWARDRGLEWIDDDSNADVRFARNYLRHHVLRGLRRRWPDVAERLAAAARKSAAEARVLQRALDAMLAAGGATADTLAIDLLVHSDCAQLLVRRWLAWGAIMGVRERVIEEIVQQMRGAPDRCPSVDVAHDVSVRRYGAHLYVVHKTAVPFAPVVWALDGDLAVGNGVLTATRGGRGGLCGRTTDVVVRPRNGGERLRLPGARGSRTVKRLLQEARVPPWWRACYPLIYIGQSIAAVPGVGVDAAFVDGGADGWQIAWRAA
jgi:tRNA(Ile)-lysidine synthase